MSKTESVIIALFLSIVCPFTFLVVGWWICASLFLSNIVPISEKAVPTCAFVGLGLGIIVVILKLKFLVSKFYVMRKILAVPIYLFWSAIAIAFFMGLPIGNIVLGLFAGFYIGRKGHHAHIGETLFEKDARKVSLFTAAITGFISLVMGILAVQEQRSMQTILTAVGMGPLAATPAGRIVLVAIAVPVLIAMQYLLTYRAATWGFRLGENKV